ncbi:MAG: LruC domain-containing protein [Bacteroidia bacterium]
MKNILTFAVLLISTNLLAQTPLPVLTAESGNRAVEQANCWGFGAISYTNTSSQLITGSWSMRSNQPTNLDPNACWIKTPWIKPGSGNITLKIKFESSGSATIRRIILSYAPYDASSSSASKEGTHIRFDSITYTPNLPTTAQNLSFAIPTAIANSTNPYVIRISFVGTGGTTRYNIDDVSVPGTYFANPSNNCLPQATIQDADSDGVADGDDAFPNDPTRAYNNFYPTSGFGSLMFEDLWPATGDYDFNDMVVDYRYNRVTNAQNNIVEIKYTFVARATGASFKNGFAFQLDNIPSSRVTAVTGSKTHGASWLNNGSNGTENGQTNVNIVVFDDIYKVLTYTGGSGINVLLSQTHSPEDTINLTVTLSTASGNATALNALTHANFNPYLIVNQVRGHEIHLANRQPSAKMNNALFNTLQDASNASQGKYFTTANNLPWALDIAVSIPHAIEKTDFLDAYLKFGAWAQSSGSTNTSWYLNESGNRDNTKLYIRQ